MTTTIAEDAVRVAQKHFKWPGLRDMQTAAIESLLDGKHTWVNQPTGGGKSGTFTIPAKLVHGTVIVFSPLIALMRDQVDKLKASGFKAERITGDMDEIDVTRIVRRLPDYEIVYVAPERLKSGAFVQRLKDIEIPYIAIDEAHMLSQCQRDFRPAYALIGQVCRKHFRRVPIIAVTATADSFIERDVTRSLGMNTYTRIIGPVDRPNLTYRVVRDYGALDIAKWIKAYHGDECGIVYANSRDRVFTLARDLRSNGISAQAYHGGMHHEERTDAQTRWMDGSITTIVATKAFGMGIDKPNVRYVFHADAPTSIHDYVQEAGRAGRDGQPSDCLLNTTEKAQRTQEYFARVSNPPMAMFDACWNAMHAKGKDESYRLNSYDLREALRTLCNPYDAPAYIPSIMGYLEYIGAIVVQPDKTVYDMIVVDQQAVEDLRARHPKNIEIKENRKVKVTLYTGDDNLAYKMKGRGIADYADRNPIEHWKVRNTRAEHGVKPAEIEDKMRATQERLRAMRCFIGAPDKAAYLREVFTASLVVEQASANGVTV